MRSPLLVRVFGVGLAAAVAALTLVLAATGRLALYISPDGAWFAVAMAVVMLVGAVASFALPLGAEGEGHAHGEADGSADAAGHAHADAARPHGATGDQDPAASRPGVAGRPGIRPPVVRPADSVATGTRGDASSRMKEPGRGSSGPAGRHAGRKRRIGPDESAAATPRRLSPADAVALAGGALAVVVVAAGVLVPPATLSAELAMSRDTGVPPLFAGADTVALASTGDTASFGVGEWASVFATTTNPDAFDGTTVTLTGFATPDDDDGFRLTRLVVTHCVIDAQPASVPVSVADAPATGDWVTVTGTVRDLGGRLVIDATDLAAVDEPEDPYEF